MNETTKRIICVVLLICLAVGSVCYSRLARDPDHYNRCIETLDETRSTVLGLTTVSTAAATVISLLPDDKGTPIADQLAEMSSYFLIILCAIYLEKFLLTVLGWVFFGWVIPILCVLLIGAVLLGNGKFQQALVKLLIFCVAVNLMIPASVVITDFIQDTYSSSISEVVDSALKITQEDDATDEETEQNLLSFFSNMFDTVKDAGTDALNVARYILNYFIDAVAVLIVTSCIIPLLTVFAFTKILKMCFQMDLSIPALAGKITDRRFPEHGNPGREGPDDCDGPNI